MNYIQVSKLSKKKRINDINLQFYPGKIYGIIGENGAGKSTFMKIIVGLIKQDTGSIKYNIKENKDLLLQNFRSKVSFLIEEPALNLGLTGEENVRHILNLYNVDYELEKMKYYFNLLGLEKYRDIKVKKYSLGMKQRLGLIEALIIEPEILILDEPFNGLDPSITIKVKKYLSKLKQQNKIIIISSHVLADMESMCDEITLISNGSIKELNYKNTFVNDNDIYKVLIDDLNEIKKIVLDKTQLDILNIGENYITLKGKKAEMNFLLLHLLQNKVKINGFYKVEKNLEEMFLDANESEGV